MTDEQAPPSRADQAKALLEGTRELPAGVQIQTQPQYTWTCPRCGHQAVTLGVARIPDNCSACNHPDPPESPEQVARLAARAAEITRQSQLDEGDLGPEGLAVREAERQHAVEEGGPAPALAEAEQQLGGELDESGPGPTVVALLDVGWARVCIGEALAEVGISADGPPEALADALADSFARLYAGERWTMFCGCPAGTHPDTFAAMEAAHPERKKAR